MAYTLITWKGNKVIITNLEVAINAGKDFEYNFKRAG